MDWHYTILWIVLIFKLTCGEYCLRTLDTLRDVATCPRNKEEWEAASKRKDCSHVKTGNCENVTYHCLRDAVTNTMVEVCTVPKNLPGRCPLFYRDPPYVRNDYDRECSNSSRCPEFYSSKDAYNYSACYNDSSIYAFGIAKGTEKSNNWILVFFLVILFLLIVVYIIAVIWVKKRKRISLRKALCIHRHILQECKKGAQDGKGIGETTKDEEVSLSFEEEIRNSRLEVNNIRNFITRLCGKGELSEAENTVANMEIEMTLIESKSSNSEFDIVQKNKKMKEDFLKVNGRIAVMKDKIIEIGYSVSSEKNSIAVQVTDDTHNENPDQKQKEFQGPLANLKSKINEVRDEITRITEIFQKVVGSGTLHDNEKAIETLNKYVTQLEKQIDNNGMTMEIRMNKCEERVKDLEERVNKYKKLHVTY